MAVKFPRASATSHTPALPALLKVEGRGWLGAEEREGKDPAYTKASWVWGRWWAEGTCGETRNHHHCFPPKSNHDFPTWGGW